MLLPTRFWVSQGPDLGICTIPVLLAGPSLRLPSPGPGGHPGRMQSRLAPCPVVPLFSPTPRWSEGEGRQQVQAQFNTVMEIHAAIALGPPHQSLDFQSCLKYQSEARTPTRTPHFLALCRYCGFFFFFLTDWRFVVTLCWASLLAPFF